MRTSRPAITGRRLLALVISALLLGAVSVELDNATAQGTAAPTVHHGHTPSR
ncbi:MAG TPA: hypothetical protein VFT50_02265 [Baekduia sp.]|nr:hypothetical protein [Baekduia sp.]